MKKEKKYENKDIKIIDGITKAISSLNKNEFTFYFFVIDCKNNPNGSMSYIYQLAKTLDDLGYNVAMLYQLENEYTETELYKLKKKNNNIDYNRVFEGVGEWLGEEYSSLKHINVSTQELSMSPSDFLFIPEVLSGLMYETFKHKLPCKRYAILQNYNYVTEFIPLGVEWKTYGIYDAIAITEKQSELIKQVFPYVHTKIINPCISDMFRKPLKSKNLVVNIVAKDQKIINRIIKPFYWKYPMYKFISFRDLRNFPKYKFAEMLQEGIITIWVDETASFGYTPLEAMRCDNIVIGKIPDTVPEWMIDNEGIINNGLWVYNINDIPDVLAKAIGSWMRDELPSELTEEIEKTKHLYTTEQWEQNVKNTFNDIVNEQVQTLETLKKNIEQNNN